MAEDEWCFNLIVMCFCLHAKCLALCLASDYGSIFCFLFELYIIIILFLKVKCYICDYPHL